MRCALIVSVLAAGAMGACSQSLTSSTPGTGGSGTGAGGAGGSSLESMCDSLVTQYQAAIVDAQTCGVGRPGQCQVKVDSALSSCGSCPTYVNDLSKPMAIEQAWFGAGCNQLPSAPCVVSTCISTTNADMCGVAPGSTHGTCSYASPGTDGGWGWPDGGSSICDTLDQKYQAAMPAAKSCNPATPTQCQTVVPLDLSCYGGCGIYVNDATELSAIQQAWDAAGCPTASVVCPGIGCLPVIGSACAATDGGGAACSTSYDVFR
ncbi:MAG TPA: hypothetical protein VMT03_14005 [Polyangia bacterium]|nr:hypothetical protein [Polyangia bacterium]